MTICNDNVSEEEKKFISGGGGGLPRVDMRRRTKSGKPYSNFKKRALLSQGGRSSESTPRLLLFSFPPRGLPGRRRVTSWPPLSPLVPFQNCFGSGRTVFLFLYRFSFIFLVSTVLTHSTLGSWKREVRPLRHDHICYDTVWYSDTTHTIRYVREEFKWLRRRYRMTVSRNPRYCHFRPKFFFWNRFHTCLKRWRHASASSFSCRSSSILCRVWLVTPCMW
jgi:hypothetical protein